MADLAFWLSTNHSLLVIAATETLAPSDHMKAQVVESVEAFFDSLIRAAHFGDASRLYPLLVDWVESRSAPIEGDYTVILPVLAKLKQSIQNQIQHLSAPEDGLALLIALNTLIDDAAIKLAQLEAETALNQLTNQLRAAEIKLERLDKSKSDFIAIAAHELKTPLTVIEGYSGILRTIADTDGEMEIVNGINTGLRRLREIVDDIVDISMLDLNMLSLHYQPVWLQHLLDAIESRTRGLVQQRNLTLCLERDSLPTRNTFADPERLRQAIEKIVMNAIKYTADGGRITVSARELPGFVDLMVEDEGIGIAPRELQRIFDPFSSIGDVALHSSGKTKYKGAGPGLGLPIAKGIIEAHGGTIWAESPGYSETDQPGSTFHIMIPMYGSPPTVQTPNAASIEQTSEE